MGTEVERVEVQSLPMAPGLLNERELRALQAQAKVAANTGLVPKALQGKPDDVLLVCLTGREMGFRGPMAALANLYPIEGRICASAQAMAGLVRSHGHDLWIEERKSDLCTVAGVRRGSTREQRLTYTLDDARRAGLLDRWVERWVQREGGGKYPERYVIGDDRDVDDGKVAKAPEWAQKLVAAGKVKCKDNWYKYPAEMCQARALSGLCRMAFSDALLGLEPHTPEELGADEVVEAEFDGFDAARRPVEDEEPVDVEIVDDDSENPNTGEGADVSADEGMPDATGPSGEVQGQNIPADADAEPTPNGEEPGSSAGTTAVATPAAPAPTSPEDENPYARAIHILAHELGLADEQVDEILFELLGDVSANAVSRDNYGPVIVRMREAAGKAA